MLSAKCSQILRTSLVSCAGIVLLSVCAACSPNLDAEATERSFVFSDRRESEVLYMLSPFTGTRPMVQYTLYGDCRLVRAEVHGNPLEPVGDVVEEYLSEGECNRLVASVVATGFVDSDPKVRRERLRRVMPVAIDARGMFIRLRLTEYQSPSRAESGPFEHIGGARKGLASTLTYSADAATTETELRELESFLSENQALLEVWNELEETYAPDVSVE